MATRQYIGARYVPLIDGDYDASKTYEPLTVVLGDDGNSYTSKTFVPAGTSLSDTTYWALTGNYNAQVESYRAETANVKNDVDDLYKMGTYVTPQMYGAIGDGVTDDTAAFQEALNTGNNVFVPTSNNEQYYIGSELYITTSRQCLFSVENGRGGEEISPTALTRNAIIFNHELTNGVIISTNGVIIANLTFTNDNRSATHYVTAIKAAAVNNIDTDLSVKNCKFFTMKTAVENTGRGLLFEDNLVIACDNGVLTDFPTPTGTGFSSPEYGNRALTVRNNRFHAIATLSVKIGGNYINSAEIIGNVLDVGRGFLQVDGSISSMTIANNVIHYCRQNNSININGDVTGLIINGNQFKGTTDAEINISTYGFIRFNGDAANVIISNNMFNCCERSAITVEGSKSLSNASITGNTFTAIGTDLNSIRADIILSTSATMENSVIIGNSAYSDDATYFINALTAYTAASLWVYANSIPSKTVANRITAGTGSTIQS